MLEVMPVHPGRIDSGQLCRVEQIGHPLKMPQKHLAQPAPPLPALPPRARPAKLRGRRRIPVGFNSTFTIVISAEGLIVPAVASIVAADVAIRKCPG